MNGFDVAGQAAEVRKSISLTGQFAVVDEILSGRENRSMDGSPPAGHRDDSLVPQDVGLTKTSSPQADR